jgi:hypothetical protein
MRHRAGRTKGVVEPSAEAAQQLRIDVGNQPIPAQSKECIGDRRARARERGLQ